MIRKVIADNHGVSDKVLKKKISEAYPFGERAMHPYKIWLSAVSYHIGGDKADTTWRTDLDKWWEKPANDKLILEPKKGYYGQSGFEA